ncbi:hypothetical protein GLYMA_13G227800v4, partial [Glycine max]|uniref:Leucine-rich repeat-containing N-terminal plant-type domain-containing protein n=1 Tax=Glycine max TaxID=3847 RepID=K7M198_SOYBN
MESWIWWFLMCWHLLILYFSPSHSLCHPHDSFALLQFKNSFTIKTSYHNYYCHPGYSKTTTWENGTDCCSWPGVTCHHISGHVTELDLTCSGLTGKIHPNSRLFHLSHLQSLNLAFNDFNQPQLSSLFGGFLSLTHLNLSGSNFEGEIPSQISHLSKLASLDFSNVFVRLTQLTTLSVLNNNLGGQIPSSLFGLTQLSDLDCSNNKLEGPLPNNITGFPILTRLSLLGNLLNGTISSWCLSLPSLVDLVLSKNQFRGLPEHISANSSHSLQSLHLSYNKLQGNIPESIFSFLNLTLLDLSSNNLRKVPILKFLDLCNNKLKGSVKLNQELSYLDLSFNSITGGISSSIYNASSINVLNLSHNKLTGIIPRCLANSSSLEVLDLQLNKLHGTLPSTFAKYCRLSTLDLNGNQLEGFLPESLSNCTSLEVLDLGNNQIKDIPNVIWKLLSLRGLNLSHNRLSGRIPKSIENLTKLESLDLSSNMLTGGIPTELSNLNFLEVLNLSNNHIG